MSGTVYLERNVDGELWSAARNWLVASKHFLWISLRTSPGRGTTSLLEHFNSRAESDKLVLGETRRILVRGRDPLKSRGPAEPTDMAAPLAGFTRGHRGHLSGILHRIADASAWQRTQLGLGTLVACAGIVLMLVLGKYFDDPNVKPFDGSFWYAFWHVWLPANFLKLPFWVGFVVVTALLGWWLKKLIPKDERPHPASIAPTKEALVDALCHAAVRQRALVLIVDRAWALSPVDLAVLAHIVREAETVGRLFRRIPRLLLVTADLEESGSHVPAGRAQVSRIKVPAFSRSEFHRIAELNHPEASVQEIADLVNGAHGNLGNLVNIGGASSESEKSAEGLEAAFRAERELSVGSVLDLFRIVVLWSVRDPAYVTKKDFYLWLREFDREFMRMLDVKAPESAEALAQKFIRSFLVRPDGDRLFLDHDATEVVRANLRATAPDLLLQAHFFWGITLVPGTGSQETAVVPADEFQRSRIRESGWHLEQVGSLLEARGMRDVFDAFPGAPRSKGRKRAEAAYGLLLAAAIHRQEAEFERAQAMARLSMAWLREAEAKARQALIRIEADSLWALYWYSGGPIQRESTMPEVIGTRVWQVHDFCRRAFTCEKGLSLDSDSPQASDLANVGRIGSIVSNATEKAGFLADALKADLVDSSEPSQAVEHRWAEFALRYMFVERYGLRSEWSKGIDELRKVAARLAETRSSAAGIAEEAMREFEVGQYAHLLLWMSTGVSDDESSIKELVRSGPWDDRPAGEFRKFLLSQARTHYVAASTDAALLGMKPLLSASTFQMGQLLKRYSPDAEHDNGANWKAWEAAFDTAIRTDKELGWKFRTPVIHRTRWEYFRHLNQPTSLADAFNAYRAMRDAGFPVAVILEWHSLLTTVLTDYGNTRQDWEHDAELHEAWARELAQLPEAQGQRHFKVVLSLEQAHALHFSAQAYRLLKRFDRAESLLAEAEDCYERGIKHRRFSEEPAGEVRSLRLGLRLQRVWLAEAQQRASDAEARLLELWNDLTTEDLVISNVLKSLTWTESRHKQLSDPWPPQPQPEGVIEFGMGPIGLPEDWLSQSDDGIRNRFELRLHQLLHLIWPGFRPGGEYLRAAAGAHFLGYEKFAEAALQMAEIERMQRYCSPLNRETVIDLLIAVREYFGVIDHNGLLELRALALLIALRPDWHECRADYIRAIVKYEELFKREIQAQIAESGDWFAVASKIHYFLGMLADESSLLNEAATSRRFATSEDLERWRTAISQALASAKEQFNQGHSERVVDIARPLLLKEPIHTVFLPDLELLDLAIRAGVASHTLSADELNHYQEIARDATLRFIGQFTNTIGEIEIQRMVVEISSYLRTLSTQQAPKTAAAGAGRG